MNWILLFLFAGAASAIRYFLHASSPEGQSHWATLFMNVLGGLVIGLVASAWGKGELNISEGTYRAFIVGFLGALTTFSTFSLETLTLFQSGKVVTAGLYFLGTNVLALAATGAGFYGFSRFLS